MFSASHTPLYTGENSRVNVGFSVSKSLRDTAYLNPKTDYN